jgi:ABC-2 type transport system ATP-binding protein
MTDEPAALSVRALTKTFGDRAALRGVDLDVPRGVAFGLLGPNGAGKTTIIRTVLGLARPTSGEIQLLGRRLPDEQRDALHRVGAVVEEPRFHARLSGRENLAIHAAVLGGDARARIAPALDRVGLAGRADDRVGGYSLGMRQRLGIARCLLCDPQLLILDEPANGLDPAGIRELRGLLRSFVDEGRTVLLCSHLLDEVERTCDRAAIIADGRVVAQGPVDEIAAADAPRVEVRVADAAGALAAARAVAGVREADLDGERLLVVLDGDGSREEAIRALVAALVAAGHVPHAVAVAEPGLEDRVLALVGGAGA